MFERTHGLVCALVVVGCGSVAPSGGPDGGHPDAQITASHWPAGWQYCTEITVNGAFPDDYSHQLVLTAQTLPSAHVKPDLSDVRFYRGGCGSNDDTESPLAMWIQSASLGSGTVWVRTPTAGASVLAMYYGNTGAASVSSGDATFLLFDDFDEAALDTTKWTPARSAQSATACSTDTVAVGAGKLTMEEVSTVGYPDTCVRDLFSTQMFQATVAAPIRVELDGLDFPHWGGVGATLGGFRAGSGGFFDGPNWPNRPNTAYIEASESGLYLYTTSNSTATNSGDQSAAIDPTTSHDYVVDWTPSAITWTTNGTATATNTSNIPQISLYVGFEVSNWDPNHPSGLLDLDRVMVMHGATPAPTYTFGPEQTAP